MTLRIIDHIKQFDRTLVSPIWGGCKAFDFLCYGHLNLAQDLGFELEQATPILTIVKDGQLTSKKQLESLIAKHEFDYAGFDSEVSCLSSMISSRNAERTGQIANESADAKDYSKAKQDAKMSAEQAYSSNQLIGGGCFGPLTIVSGILGAERLLKLVVKDPEFVYEFVSYVTSFIKELAAKEAAAGQEFFWIAEPLAALLPPEKFWEFSGQFIKDIFRAACAPGFLHVCGKTDPHTPFLVQTGCDVLSIDYCTDIGKCIREVGENVVVMGNVSPQVLRLGTKEEVRGAVDSILDATSERQNFVLSTGCSIMDGTPDENMQVLFDACELQR